MHVAAEVFAGKSVPQLVKDDDDRAGEPQDYKVARTQPEGVQIGQCLGKLSPLEGDDQEVEDKEHH